MIKNKIMDSIKQIQVISSNANDLVSVNGHSKNLEFIGVGTDAAVFRLLDEPELAIKVFSEDKLVKMESEIQVYKTLGQTEFFPHFYGQGPNFLLLSFEQGLTLYDCLLKGVHIPLKAIEDVERARNYAAERGLNASDIHLKNILLHEGRAKVIDVSEYMKEDSDKRWDYLKRGYLDYYHLIDGREIPLWIMEAVRKAYHQQSNAPFNLQNFIEKFVRLFKL
ncbi:serine/threonine protein kinase [Halalkalibacter okhensis]|uniref:Serine/threonine protein kinase n=1 Tax=Halalkalibacter okhensis TaxID=333138 RepID=A0A0B0IGY2_9BACI|nr:serine/threonine protein kinase [Halalkalibacter okhensis]KHF38896.1 serine/threonine protein kinase [Halalkalibacter okhensis]